MLFNPCIFNSQVFNVGDEPLFRGHVRRRGKYGKYRELEIYAPLNSEEQDALSVIAARIAQNEIAADIKAEKLKNNEKSIAATLLKIEALQTKSEGLRRQAEILSDLIKIQKRFMDDEEDIASLLMLL